MSWKKLTQDNKVKLAIFFLAALFAVIGYFGKNYFESSTSNDKKIIGTQDPEPDPGPPEPDEPPSEPPPPIDEKKKNDPPPPYTQTPAPSGENVCDIGQIRIILTGQHDNIVWIGFPNGATIDESIYDGEWYKCGKDVTSNGINLVGVRYGRKRDVHNLYGLTDSGEVVKKNIRIHNGTQHEVSIQGNQYHIVYGRKKDLLRIVTFDGNKFTVTRER